MTDEAFGEVVIPDPSALVARVATVVPKLPAAAVGFLDAGVLAQAGVNLRAPLRVIAVAPRDGETAIGWGVLLVPADPVRLDAAALKLGWARRKVGAAYLVGPRIDRISDATANAALSRPLTTAPAFRLLSGERAGPAWTAVSEGITSGLEGSSRTWVTALALAGWQTLIQLESMTLSLPDTGGDVTIEVVMTARRGSKLAATFDVWRAASLTLVGPVGQMDVLIAGRLDGIATEALEFLSFGRMFHARYDEAALRAALRALPRAGATEIAIGMSQGRVHWLAEGAAKDLLEAFTGVQGWLASLSGRKLESRKSAFRHGGFVAEQLTSERAVALSAVRGGRAVGAIGPTEDAARADFRAALDPTRTLAPGRQAIVDAARARGDSLLLIVDNTMLEPAAPGPLLAVSVGRPAAGAFRLRVALAAGPAQRFLRTFLEPNPAVLFAEDAAQQLCACPDVPCARRVVESFQAAYQAKFSRATGTKADLERINRAGQRMTECVGKLSAGPTR